MRALLVSPDPALALASEAGGAPRAGAGPHPPLGLLYLQAAAERGGRHLVDILDANREGGLDAALRETHGLDGVGLAGVTALTPNLPSVVRAIATLRAALPGARIVVGGPHADLFPVETARLAGVDYVLTGEAEQTLTALLDSLDAGETAPDIEGLYLRGAEARRDGPCPRAPDLDALPLPDRSRLPVWRYRGVAGQDVLFATAITSRGCPYRCTFCSTPQGRPRLRSVESILDEMERCARIGVEHIYFVDDTFPTGGRRLSALCDAIARRPHLPSWSCRTASAGLTEEALRLMKRARCTRIQIGVETCTDEGLAVLGKKTTVAQIRQTFAACRRAAVPSMAYFMIGLPNERTAADVRRLIRFAVELDPTFAMFNVLTLYPGTALFSEAVARRLVGPDIWQRFAERPDRSFVPPIWDEHLGRRELLALQARAYRAFYLRPSVVARQLLLGGGLGRKARAGLSMLLGRT